MSGVQLFTPDLFPSLSAACSTALSANISCSYIETGDEAYHFNANYTTETLSYLCSDGCSDSIHEYRSSVISACGNETYSFTDDDGEGDNALVLRPIALPDYYLNNHFQRCLTDRYVPLPASLTCQLTSVPAATATSATLSSSLPRKRY